MAKKTNFKSKPTNNKRTCVSRFLYITKTRWGTYELLSEQQYERKLIFG